MKNLTLGIVPKFFSGPPIYVGSWPLNFRNISQWKFFHRHRQCHRQCHKLPDVDTDIDAYISIKAVTRGNFVNTVHFYSVICSWIKTNMVDNKTLSIPTDLNNFKTQRHALENMTLLNGTWWPTKCAYKTKRILHVSKHCKNIGKERKNCQRITYTHIVEMNL